MLRYSIIDNTSGTPVETIIDEPVGLDAITLHLSRDKQYHGFFDQINDTLGGLRYYGDGYTILTDAYNNYGIDADVQLLIKYACSDTDGYDTLYRGRFNFSKFKQVTGAQGCYVETGLENGNWLVWLKNRMDNQVSLDSRVHFDEGYSELPAYAGLDMSIVLPAKTIRLIDYAVYNYVPEYYEQP